MEEREPVIKILYENTTRPVNRVLLTFPLSGREKQEQKMLALTRGHEGKSSIPFRHLRFFFSCDGGVLVDDVQCFIIVLASASCDAFLQKQEQKMLALTRGHEGKSSIPFRIAKVESPIPGLDRYLPDVQCFIIVLASASCDAFLHFLRLILHPVFPQGPGRNPHQVEDISALTGICLRMAGFRRSAAWQRRSEGWTGKSR